MDWSARQVVSCQILQNKPTRSRKSRLKIIPQRNNNSLDVDSTNYEAVQLLQLEVEKDENIAHTEHLTNLNSLRANLFKSSRVVLGSGRLLLSGKARSVARALLDVLARANTKLNRGFRLASPPDQTPWKRSFLAASGPPEWSQLFVSFRGGCLSAGTTHKCHFYGPTDQQAPTG